MGNSLICLPISSHGFEYFVGSYDWTVLLHRKIFATKCNTSTLCNNCNKYTNHLYTLAKFHIWVITFRVITLRIAKIWYCVLRQFLITFFGIRSVRVQPKARIALRKICLQQLITLKCDRKCCQGQLIDFCANICNIFFKVVLLIYCESTCIFLLANCMSLNWRNCTELTIRKKVAHVNSFRYIGFLSVKNSLS